MAADGQLARTDQLSRTPDGRRVPADSVAGLFPPDPARPAEAVPAAGEAFALTDDSADEPLPVVRPRQRQPAVAEAPTPPARKRRGGLFDLGFTRFMSPTLVKVLWGLWLFVAVPLATLGILVLFVLGLDEATKGTSRSPSMLSVVGLAAGQLAGLAVYTLLVRVMLETTVALVRGAEAVVAIDARQRAADG